MRRALHRWFTLAFALSVYISVVMFASGVMLIVIAHMLQILGLLDSFEAMRGNPVSRAQRLRCPLG